MRLVQSLNASLQIVSTPSAIVTLVNLVQPSKQLVPISLMLLPIVMVESLLHPLKVPLLKVIRLPGNVIVSRFTQFEKTLPPRYSIFSGIVMLVNALHPSKAAPYTLLMLVGKTTLVSVEHDAKHHVKSGFAYNWW